MNESTKFPPEWRRDVLEARRAKIAAGEVEYFTIGEAEARGSSGARRSGRRKVNKEGFEG